MPWAVMVLLAVAGPTAVARNPVAPPPEIYLQCLRDFERYAETIWHEAQVPAASGYFGDGRSQGNGGIRGTCGIAVAYATLALAEQGGVERPRRVARVTAALRYAADTHVSGPARCVDGKQWGHGWQTCLWSGSLGLAACLLQDEVPHELRAACRRVLASEAERLAAIPPASGYRADSKAEENAWNSNAVALAAAWMQDAPNAASWLVGAKRYTANTYTVADKDGDVLAPWLSTTTLYPSFLCENHGFFHPSYQMVSGMSLGDSLLMARMGDPGVAAELAPFAEHNVLPAWHSVSQVLLDSGEMAYPSGLDWALHGYGQVSYYAWLATHFDDPLARWAEPRLARLLAARQQQAGDGRFTGDSVRNGFYREAVMARRTAIAWLHHRYAEPAGSPARGPDPFVRHLPDAKLLLQRSAQGFFSVSYGPRIMALVLPGCVAHPDDPYVVTPRTGSLLGAASKAHLRHLSTGTASFEIELRLDHSSLPVSLVRLACFGDVLATVEAPLAPYVPHHDQGVFPIGIENHALTGGERRLTWPGGSVGIRALSGDTAKTPHGVVSVDGRLNLVAGPGGSFQYTSARDYNRPGAAEDVLCYLPEAETACRYLIAAPNLSPTQQARLAQSVEWTVTAEDVTLRFEGPESGVHAVTLKTAGQYHPAMGSVDVAQVSASSFSTRHPPKLATDGDITTFWVSRRGSAAPGDGPTWDRPEMLTFRFAGRAAVSRILICPRPRYGPRKITVRIAAREVYSGPMEAEPLCIRLDAPLTTDTVELVVADAHDPRYPETPRNVQIAEVLFLAQLQASPARP